MRVWWSDSKNEWLFFLELINKLGENYRSTQIHPNRVKLKDFLLDIGEERPSSSTHLIYKEAKVSALQTHLYPSLCGNPMVSSMERSAARPRKCAFQAHHY